MASRTVRLNAFQRAMFKWNALHPYNAVHVVEIGEPLKRDGLHASITSALGKFGFTEILLDSATKPSRIALFTAERPKLEVQLLPDAAPETLDREIERQLNKPFPCGLRVQPYRWLAQDRGSTFVLAVTYFHIVADAESVVWLLRSCVEDYHARAHQKPASNLSFRVYPSPPKPYLWHFCMPCLRRLARIPAMALSMRRCRRTPLTNHKDFSNAFIFFSVPSQGMRAVQNAAKSWGVTVNDLFLAFLIKSVSGVARGRLGAEKRKRIAVGCIVNLRRDLGFGPEPAFGLFLGSFFVTNEYAEGISLENLAQNIREQTKEIKLRRLPLGTPIDLAFNGLLFSLFSTDRQKKLYHRNYPLWGGVTNMNLNSIWSQQQSGPGLINYFRAVSTGPATPLVLSTTTTGERLNVGLTYRTAVFSKADIHLIKTQFLECINQI